MERAILSVVVAAMSPIIRKLRDSYFGGDVTSQEIRKLQTIIIPKIQTVIEATEAIPTDKLMPWLMDLKAATFEAEDVLDLYEYEAIKNKVISSYKPIEKLKAKSKEFLAFMLPKTKLKNSLEKLEQSANEAEKLLPFISVIRQTAPQHDAKSQHSTTTVSGMSSPIFGRAEECHNLIDMLINEVGGRSTCYRTNILVLAIYGIGGAGKTTMAQAVYNDLRVECHFGIRMWVHVSRNFDVHRVTREIIESTGQGGSICSAINNLDALQKMLEGILSSSILNSKKLLLVLDDIWCEDKGEWDKLLVPLNKVGDKGSRILITTRTKGVAMSVGVENENILPLKELKVEECRSILKYYAFGDTSNIIEDRALTDVLEKIAYKLKNSPLAARLVGCLLRRNVDVDAWEMILKQDLLSDTLDCILLSFQFLPPHLQRCFAFCSLFPKGHTFGTYKIYEDAIVVDDLVLLWIAEGFVEASKDNELTTVERGRQYFNELVSYSFFQSHPSSYGYVIHDLLHDLAEKVSKGYCFRIEADGPVDIPATTIHLSIMKELAPVPFPDVSVLVNLRTIMCMSPDLDIPSLDACTKLRVLDYRGLMPKVPSSICQLKHLRYLRAHGVTQLPDSFGRLYHLQFVQLPNHVIERVPRSFSNLVNLQCLMAGDHYLLKISDIGKLTLLHTLESYHVGTSKEFGIGQLKNLHRLGGSLAIKGLENVKDKTEASEARLNQKEHLKDLSLKWDPRRGRAEDEEVLEGIEPHSNLTCLKISGYQGAKAPTWMQRDLSSLRLLRLIDCPSLTGFSHLPHRLKRLEVINCPELKQLSPFPCSLEGLRVENSSGFEDLFSIFMSFNEDDDEEEEQWRLHQQSCGLPQPFALHHLEIKGCSVVGGEKFKLSLQKFDLLSVLDLWRLPRITSLLLGPNLRQLHRIIIKNCENLQSLEGIRALPHLEHLQVNDLPELTGMGNLKALKSLKVSKCPKLATGVGGASRGGAMAHRLPSINKGSVDIDEPMLLGVLLEEQGLNSIVILNIIECSRDVPFSTEEEDLFLQLTSITSLTFYKCEKLPSLPTNLEKLASLKKLDVWDCREMESLPNLPTSLDCLYTWGCPKLKDKYRVGGPLRNNITHIPNIRIDTSL